MILMRSNGGIVFSDSTSFPTRIHCQRLPSMKSLCTLRNASWKSISESMYAGPKNVDEQIDEVCEVRKERPRAPESRHFIRSGARTNHWEARPK